MGVTRKDAITVKARTDCSGDNRWRLGSGTDMVLEVENMWRGLTANREQLPKSQLIGVGSKSNALQQQWLSQSC
jgi:hypothetical protein